MDDKERLGNVVAVSVDMLRHDWLYAKDETTRIDALSRGTMRLMAFLRIYGLPDEADEMMAFVVSILLEECARSRRVE